MKKIHLCKCGHELDADHKKEVVTLGIRHHELDYCTKCCCHGYVDRKYPTKSDTFSIFLVIGMMGMIIGIILFFGISADSHYHELQIKDPEHILTKTLLTYHTAMKWALLVSIVISAWLGSSVFGWYMDYRRRKNIEVRNPITSSQGSKEE